MYEIIVTVGLLLVSGVIALAITNLLTGKGGSKGITQKPYNTKDGVKRTAKKSREDHVV